MEPGLYSLASGLLGVIVGSLLTSFSNWRLKEKEVKLRLKEKILDKRIEANEQALELAKLMRLTGTLNEVDSGSNLLTFTGIMIDKISFETFEGRFSDVFNHQSHWLSNDIVKELSFIQDYLATLKISMKEVSEENYLKAATIVKPDFTDLRHHWKSVSINFLIWIYII